MNQVQQSKIKVHFQRFEFKYQLPLETVEGIVPELLKYMEFDSYAQNLADQAYTVSSLYYDSAGLDCYYQKVAGLRVRKKLRLRVYDFNLQPETPVFLEIKRKYDMVVVKDRLKLTHRQAKDLLQNNKMPKIAFSEHDKDTLNEFLWLKLFNGMVPQNIVSYQRKPLMSKIDPNFRVTIDYNLATYLAHWLTPNGRVIEVAPGTAVLEVKFNNILPAWFHHIIQRYNLDQRPFSKYCNSIELCRPDLAATVSTRSSYQARTL